ncbi:MAG: DsrE/DsrF/DrsH-like family protein [Dehalococcoidales bacterium]
MTYYSESGAQQVAIILHSGSYDRVTNALSLASVCLAMEMEVTILLTYEGINRFVKEGSEDSGGTDSELMAMIQGGIEAGNIRSIREKLISAKEMGLKLFACTNAMSIMGLTLEDMVEEVDDIMGLATFIQFARNATINWYI